MHPMVSWTRPLSFEWVTLQNGETILDTRRTSIQTIGINPNETNERRSAELDIIVWNEIN